MKRLLNMIFWGSPEGPEIKIDWDRRTVECLRMPNWLALRVLAWIIRGEMSDPPGIVS